MSSAPSPRSLLHWLRYWKPATVVGVDDNGEETRLAVTSGQQRYAVIAKSLNDLSCVSCRALDSKDAVLATLVLRIIENEAPSLPAVNSPATAGGVDVAAIVNTVAQACMAIVRDTLRESAAAHKESFIELVNLSKQSNERAATLERERSRDLDERRARIEDEEQRLDEEREAERTEREKETAEKEEMGEIIKPLLQMAGPELMKKLLSNGKAAPAVAAPAPSVKPKPAAPPDGAA